MPKRIITTEQAIIFIKRRLKSFFIQDSAIVAELLDTELSEIVDCAFESVKRGDKWGIKGVIRKRKHPVEGERDYFLKSIEVCDANHADYTAGSLLTGIDSIK